MINNKILGGFVILMLLTGCQSGGDISPEKVQKLALMQEKRMGVIQSLGGTFTSSKATNLLRMDDGKTIYLRSDVLDLNSVKYSAKEVEVMGEITRTTDGNQTMAVTNIDVLDTEVSTNQDIPVWVDYSSDNLGLSLKYRNDFEFTDSGKTISMLVKPQKSASAQPIVDANAKNSEMQLVLLSKDASFDLAKEMGVASLSPADVLAGGFNRSKITQKGLDAYKQAADSGKSIVYFLKNSEGSYKISFAAGDKADQLISDQNLFYDVLASIDFVGSPLANADTAAVPVAKSEGGVANSTPNDVTITGNQSVEPVVEAALTDGTITGFEKFTSTSQKFSIQYPKSYYFGNVTPASKDAKITYQFGSKPLEAQPGEILLDIVSSLPGDGKSTDYNGTSMTKVVSGNEVSVYLNKDGKIFKMTGPSLKEGLMEQMLASIAN